MATRFYLPISGTPGVTPSAWGGGWTYTSGTGAGAVTAPAVTAKSNTALTVYAFTEPSGVASPNTAVLGRWISDPLSAQTINAATITGYVRASEGSSTTNATLAVWMGLVNGDGSAGTEVLALSSPDATTTPPEFDVDAALTVSARQFLDASEAAPTTGSVSVSGGQRLVIEIGIRFANAVSGRSARLTFGDPVGSTDFAAENTDDDCPWVEISQTLNFASAGGNRRRRLLLCGSR